MPGAVEDCQGVYDERRKNSGQEKEAAAEIDRGRSTGPVDRRARSAQVCSQVIPVDRTGRPKQFSEATQVSVGARSTGSVDRRGSLKQLKSLLEPGRPSGRPTWRTQVTALDRSTGRSTDRRVLGEICCFEKLCI